MNLDLNKVPRRDYIFCLIMMAGFLTGCGTFESRQPGTPVEPPRNLLRVDDQVTVVFGGISNPPDRFDGRIKEDGTITLPLSVVIKAEGQTTGQLEKEIKTNYVPRFFRQDSGFTVMVNAENRYFTVDGYVRNPSRQVYIGQMSVINAIAAAGGFTEFANKKKVKLTRSNGEIHVINWEKVRNKPDLDLPVYPGDYIYVPRRYF